MDKRIAFFRKVIAEKRDREAPQVCLESPFAYSYPDARTAFETAPGAELPALEALASLGYLEREFHDKVHVCPACERWTLNFRELCPQCGSANISVVQMVHHLRCGHVGPERDFRDGVQLRCPKCTHLLRHIGIDYERPASSYLCAGCDFIFADSRVECVCFSCAKSFPVERVPVRPVYAYRLTPSAQAAAASGVIDEKTPAGFFDSDLALYTRQFFLERLQQEVKAAARYDRPLAVLLVLLNDFDGYAERHGAETAVRLQRRLAQRLKETLRETDVPALFSRGLFAVLLVDTPESGARATVQRLSESLAAPQGDDPPIPCSMGVGTAAMRDLSPRLLLQRAEEEVQAALAASGHSAVSLAVSTVTA